MIAGPGAEGEVTGDAHGVLTQRQVTLGGNVSAGCGLASVSDVAITIPTLTANHGVITAPRTRWNIWRVSHCLDGRASDLAGGGS